MMSFLVSLVAQTVKCPPQCQRPGFDLWVGKIPWRRKWQPTPVLLLGKSHGQRSLVGYGPWGHKESDTTEQLHFSFRFNEVISFIIQLDFFSHFGFHPEI